MRVTDLTKQNAVLRNIGNNTDRLQNLQENISSGRRINRLSDDPIGATRTQDIKTQLSFFEMLQRTLQSNFIWLDRSETELEHIGSLLRRAKILTLAQANANADAATRRVTAEEMQAIIDGAFQSGNAKIGKLFIFAGSKTFTRPLGVSPLTQPAKLQLAGNQFPTEIAHFVGYSNNPYIVRITQPGSMGAARYVVSDDGGETWSGEKTLAPRIALVNETGKPSEKVALKIVVPPRETPEQALVFPAGL